MKHIKNKYLYFIITALEVFLTFAILYWNNLKDAKMGVVRHITFWNAKKFPNIFSDNIKYLIVVILILLVIFQLTKISKLAFIGQVEISINILLLLVSITFIFKSNVDIEFIYYYVVIYLVLINILQFIKHFAFDKITKI